jgi:hypothetical protein
MANASQYYLQYIHEVSGGYRATWDPALPLQIGDLVKIDDFGVLNIFGSLADKGIIPVVRQTVSPLDWKLSSQRGIKVNVKLAGKLPVATSTLADVDAGFNIQFDSSNSVLFNISGYTTSVITNLDEIEAAVLAQYHKKTWDADLLIITNLIHADAATIIISDKGAASIDLKAKANIQAGDLKLTDTSLGLTCTRETGSTTQFIALGGLTPLYKVMGLRGLFSKHLDTREVGFTGEAPAAESPGLKEIEPDFF